MALRILALAAAVAVSMVGAASQAATTLIDFDDGSAPGFSGDFTVFPAAGTPNAAATVNGTRFLAVPTNGSPSGLATYTSANPITSFSFDWGTPDSYNSLTFLSGSTVVAPTGITGAGLAPGRYTYTFAASDQVGSVRFGSSQAAFEIDNLAVTAVPEPATWGLLIAGFAMVGVAARRRATNLTA